MTLIPPIGYAAGVGAIDDGKEESVNWFNTRAGAAAERNEEGSSATPGVGRGEYHG
jgi:hypothetical protein